MLGKRGVWIGIACLAISITVVWLWLSKRTARSRYERLVELGAIARRDKWGHVKQINLWPKDVAAEELDLLTRLPHLRLLNLHDTDTTDADLRYIVRISSLEQLILAGTRITDNGLPHLAALENLQRVSLTPSAVTSAGVHRLSQARPDLQIVVNPLELCGLGHLRKYGAHGALDDKFRLIALDLNGTSVTNDDLRPVASCRLLRMINLSGTRIDDAGLDHLRSLDSVRELWLTGTAVTDDGLEKLAGMVQLRAVSLSRTRVTDVGMAHLKALPELEIVHLGETDVGDGGLRHLLGLRRLKEVYVTQTRATKDGAAELANAIPSLQVFGASESEPAKQAEEIESYVLG